MTPRRTSHPTTPGHAPQTSPPGRARHPAVLLAAGAATIAAAAALTLGAAGTHATDTNGKDANGTGTKGAVTTGLHAAGHSSAETAPRQAGTGGPRLDLVDQTYSVAPDGTVRLEYRLSGLDGDPLELATTTTTTTTTPPTTTTSPSPTDPGIAGDTASGTVPTTAPAPTTTVAPPVQLTAQIINFSPLTDVTDVPRVVGGDVDPDDFRRVSSVVDGLEIDVRPLATVDDDGVVTFAIDVGTDVTPSVEDRLEMDRPGLYPVRVQLLIGDPADERIVATAGTIVQRLPGPTDPAAPPPIDLAVVAATPEPKPNGTPADVAATSSAVDAAIDFADRFPATAALQLPPTLVAEETATTAGADRVAAALADDELIPSPIVELDVSSAAAADRADTYTNLVIAGEELLTDAVPTTPTRRDVALADTPISGPGAQLLRDLGARYLVMTPEAYRATVGEDPPATDVFLTAELPDGTMPVIVLDDLSRDLTATATDRILERNTTTEWAVQAISEMLLEQALDDFAAANGTIGAAERTRVLSAPGFAPPDPTLLSALHTMSASTPSIRFATPSAITGVTDVFTDDGEPVTIALPAVAGPSLTDRIAVLEATALTMYSASTMLPDDDPRPAAWTTELESLISTAYSDAEVLAATAEMQAEAQQLRSAVVLPEPFTFTLTGRSGTIEVRLTNTLDEPLDVLVHLESPKLTFPDGDQTVTLRPLTETSVIVPVEARANGTSSIELLVSTPAGEPLADPTTLTATVTALTGFGQALTAGLVLVLLTWWFSHWRSRRRAALDDPSPDSDAADDHDLEVESDAL